MTAEARYVIAADPLQVDAAGPPPRPETARAGAATWTFTDEDQSDLPALRRWLRENGVTDVGEHGLGTTATTRPGHRGPYAIVGLGWAVWTGHPVTRRMPCRACGIPVEMIGHPSPPAAGAAGPLRILAGAPLGYLTREECLVATPELLDLVRSAGLTAGLATRPLDADGRAHPLWSEAPLGGPAYPFGPEPCPACGRAVDLRRPTYAYRLTFAAEPAHWSWSTVFGQPTPLVSAAVATLLGELVPGVAFHRHGRPCDPDAFLPERCR